MKKTIYIFSDGELKRKENTLYFQSEKGKKYVPVENTKEIMAFGEVTLNKKLLEFLSQQEIMLHYFNHYGYYMGTFYPREHYNSGYMILKQAESYLDREKRIDLAKRFVEGAVLNMKRVLNYYANRGKSVSEYIDRIDSISPAIEECNYTDELMAIEGNIREQYYNAFDNILENENFTFEGRTRRPPKNRLNSLISFGNSLLYARVLSEIYKTHLDPRIGFLHTTNQRRFTLNLDVSEPFKPIIVDRIIFNLINKNMIKTRHFEQKLGGIVLNEKGRELFVREFDERLKNTVKHKRLKRNVSYEGMIRLDLYKIEKHLMGEEKYTPFVTGW
ncbi:MAG: subtype I-B CRISPR-associated endonuclease Cas1 [bacterium (Candidatus Stahlbacteria) CG23_combo_of_CG06-09_8_20_14_all_40_9]|nr:MAG: subtype I-B CRISPR-associated endonuclease Cas1 [bacterium (Candidatus Stahlbacteria) CG23_combo_of_CG06-09_8_20_14_all_40_9]